MKERHLKIYEAPGQKRNVPRINLQGDWLSVSCNQGKLIVELEPIIPAKAHS
jgi:hypothetical protein